MLRIITELIYKYKVEIFLIQYSHEHTQYHLLSLLYIIGQKSFGHMHLSE